MIFDIIKHAKQLLYDNSKSKLKSTDVQGAVDELNESVDTLNDSLSPNIIFSSGGIVVKKYGKILVIDFQDAKMNNGGVMPIPGNYTIAYTAVATLRNITDKSPATLFVNPDKTCVIADFNGNVLSNKYYYGQIIVLIN